MKKLTATGLLLAAFAVPTVVGAAHDSAVYATKAECKAALQMARAEDASFWMRECRPEGEGWSFRLKDRGDASTKGSGN